MVDSRVRQTFTDSEEADKRKKHGQFLYLINERNLNADDYFVQL